MYVSTYELHVKYGYSANLVKYTTGLDWYVFSCLRFCVNVSNIHFTFCTVS